MLGASGGRSVTMCRIREHLLRSASRIRARHRRQTRSGASARCPARQESRPASRRLRTLEQTIAGVQRRKYLAALRVHPDGDFAVTRSRAEGLRAEGANGVRSTRRARKRRSSGRLFASARPCMRRDADAQSGERSGSRGHGKHSRHRRRAAPWALNNRSRSPGSRSPCVIVASPA